ncbi:PTS sugar transporter subunit IIA [Wukongibacter sp. M2B1]|uniref:PTS sugar transporter subunit IIA n=1 Tax=Wukongibacter sp. M2B1 TaxID=3088895 RepID=UPI003D78D96C
MAAINLMTVAMTEKSGLPGGILGIVIFVVASFLVASLFMKRKGSTEKAFEGEKEQGLNPKNPSSNEEPFVVDEDKKCNDEILRKENILLDLKSVDKEEAIKMAGQLLVDGEYVEEEYIKAMLEREELVSTYIGNGIAIPHGVGSSKDRIKKSGIVVLQFPEGVDFGENNKAYLVLGIAGKDNEHLKILSNIATSLEDKETVEKLVKTKDVNRIQKILTAN